MGRNAFTDLGYSNERAAEMALRVSVALQIASLISDRGLTQTQAASLFGVPQPTISKIKRLRLEKLSLALLLKMLFKAGVPFTITHSGSAEFVHATVDTSFTAEKKIRPNWHWEKGQMASGQSIQVVQAISPVVN